MAAQTYRIDLAKANYANLAGQLLNVLENLNQSFVQLQLIRAAMIQQRDSSLGTSADWVTMSQCFGFVDPVLDTISSTIAMSAFTAIDSMNTTCASSLQQTCAQFKQ
jgi:hypothetical protein